MLLQRRTYLRVLFPQNVVFVMCVLNLHAVPVSSQSIKKNPTATSVAVASWFGGSV